MGVKGFPAMRDQATIDQIQDLLAKNWTYRTIAARLGMSREAVADLVASANEAKRRKKPGPKRLLKFQAIPRPGRVTGDGPGRGCRCRRISRRRIRGGNIDSPGCRKASRLVRGCPRP